jgi:hypothetical protein
LGTGYFAPQKRDLSAGLWHSVLTATATPRTLKQRTIESALASPPSTNTGSFFELLFAMTYLQ